MTPLGRAAVAARRGEDGIAARPLRRTQFARRGRVAMPNAVSCHAWRLVARATLVALSLGLALPAGARAQDTQGTDGATGFSVDGVVRSTRGGFGFPDGSVMSARPRLETGGPYDCAAEVGQSQSCPIDGRWDMCALSGIALGVFNSFSEPHCGVVDQGDGRWSIDVVTGGQFRMRCSARCLRMPAR